MNQRRTLLTGGLLYDGLGTEPAVTDVLLEGEQIAAISPAGTIDVTDETTVLEVRGLEVLPGFIDVHSHDDAAIFRDTAVDPKLAQGVTTTVIGNCGHGCAPSIPGGVLEEYSTPVLGPFPDRSWPTFGEYLNDIERRNPVINVAGLVPHAPIRASVMGMIRRPADDRERDAISGSFADALDAGAAGVSFGLMYAPGNSAKASELVSIADVVAQRDKLVVAHIRNEADLIEQSLEELIGLAKRTGVAVHVSHLKVTGPRNVGRMPALIEKLDAWRSAGIDVTADVYPYEAGSTTVATLFPPWSVENGVESVLENLRDPVRRSAIIRDLTVEWEGGLENYYASLGPDAILLAGFKLPENARFEGRSIADIAAELGADPAECLVELVLSELAKLTVILFQSDVNGIATALEWPHTLIGSDGLPRETGYVHPRLFGTFSRILERYSGPGAPLSRIEAVSRMSAGAARRFGLATKVGITPGMDADLQVIDPGRYADRATFADPRREPAGVGPVFVRGRSDSARSGALARVFRADQGGLR